MERKKILIVLGNPCKESFNRVLFEEYINGAKEGEHQIRTIDLSKLKFDPILWEGYKKNQELEPDLKRAQEDILWSNHIVFVFPVWWGGLPAIMQGFIDRTFTPGFAFKYKKNSIMPEKLLKGRSARLIITSGSETYIYALIGGIPIIRAMKVLTLWLCGIMPTRITKIGYARDISEKKFKKILEKIRILGEKGI